MEISMTEFFISLTILTAIEQYGMKYSIVPTTPVQDNTSAYVECEYVEKTVKAL